MNEILNTELQYLKGVGEKRAKLLEKGAGLRTWGDLLQYFPYKHIDRTRIYKTTELTEEMPYVQLKGEIVGFRQEGEKYKKRLKATFRDEYGAIELVWFNGGEYILRNYKIRTHYIIFGKPSKYNNYYTIAHPEIELAGLPNGSVGKLYPIYSISEQMKRRQMSSKVVSQMVKNALGEIRGRLSETLPDYLVQEYQMLPLWEAYSNMHFPATADLLRRATMRLKMEELFYLRLRMRYLHDQRAANSAGVPLQKVGESFNKLYHEGLEFDLTSAQKRVLKEIRADVVSGHQMNRLLQGDVGSGKTIVALLSMLLAVDNGYQACIMAPTEILATQHLHTIRKYLQGQPNIRVELLTGSMTQKERRPVLEAVEQGEVQILVGTHILVQEYVQFNNLGLAVIDEQQRFGVEQRSKLWEKSSRVAPHILIMTATPIPRTLAMTMYGDLDVSVIDELPPGRTPIETKHAYDHQMHSVYAFIFEQLREGRQVYLVYPLIEENEKVDLESLEKGYEDIKAVFPAHKVGMVHGKLKPEVKDAEMEAFAQGDTHILVATTVIEVGVNVPNASVMVINNAERFGLSQLHQLRGRVGRGAKQSYCILVTSSNISQNSRQRIRVMCSTTDGFVIAEEDLKLRGHGDIEGTRQSGTGEYLKVADLGKDARLVQFSANLADAILKEDPHLTHPANAILRNQLAEILKEEKDWGVIS